MTSLQKTPFPEILFILSNPTQIQTVSPHSLFLTERTTSLAENPTSFPAHFTDSYPVIPPQDSRPITESNLGNTIMNRQHIPQLTMQQTSLDNIDQLQTLSPDNPVISPELGVSDIYRVLRVDILKEHHPEEEGWDELMSTGSCASEEQRSDGENFMEEDRDPLSKPAEEKRRKEKDHLQKEEETRLREEKEGRLRKEEEERLRKEEEERLQKEEEDRKRKEEEERQKREEEERLRKEEEERLAREKAEEEARLKAEEEERLRREEEERLRKEEEERLKQEEDERLKKEEEERLKKEEEERLKKEEEERLKKEEEERLACEKAEEEERLQKEEERIAREKAEEEERLRKEEERVRKEEEEHQKREEARIAREKAEKEEILHKEEEERKRREEEEHIAREKAEEEERRRKEEEEERIAREKAEEEERKRLEEERLRKEEEERLRKEEEERTRKEEEERLKQEEEERLRKEEEEKAKKEEEERLKQEEEDKAKKEEEERLKKEEEERLKQEEDERLKKDEEERLRKEDEKAKKEEERDRREEEETVKREEDERLAREKAEEEERLRKEEEESRRKEEEERHRREEEERLAREKAEEEERLRKEEEERLRKEEEERKRKEEEEERLRKEEEERLAHEKAEEEARLKAEEEERLRREEEERLRKEEEERLKQEEDERLKKEEEERLKNEEEEKAKKEEEERLKKEEEERLKKEEEERLKQEEEKAKKEEEERLKKEEEERLKKEEEERLKQEEEKAKKEEEERLKKEEEERLKKEEEERLKQEEDERLKKEEEERLKKEEEERLKKEEEERLKQEEEEKAKKEEEERLKKEEEERLKKEEEERLKQEEEEKAKKEEEERLKKEEEERLKKEEEERLKQEEEEKAKKDEEERLRKEEEEKVKKEEEEKLKNEEEARNKEADSLQNKNEQEVTQTKEEEPPTELDQPEEAKIASDSRDHPLSPHVTTVLFTATLEDRDWCVVGDCLELDNWDPVASLARSEKTVTSGPYRCLRRSLKMDEEVEFKMVRIVDGKQEWEQGSNRKLFISSTYQGPRNVDLVFGDNQSFHFETRLTLVSEELDSSLPLSLSPDKPVQPELAESLLTIERTSTTPLQPIEQQQSPDERSPLDASTLQQTPNSLSSIQSEPILLLPTQIPMPSTTDNAETEEMKREKKEKNRQIARQHVLNEILSTERSYVEQLSTFMSVFVEPCRKRKDELGVTDDQLKTIFGPIQIILETNKELLQSLAESVEENSGSTIGPVITQMAGYLNCYKPYIKNYARASSTLEQVKKKNKAFRKFLQKCSNDRLSMNFPIESFLILPVQRLPRYKMLLESLLKNTLPDNPQFTQIEKAFETISALAESVNAECHESEERNNVVLFYQELEQARKHGDEKQKSRPFDQSAIITPARRLLSRIEVAAKSDVAAEGEGEGMSQMIQSVFSPDKTWMEFLLFTDAVALVQHPTKTKKKSHSSRGSEVIESNLLWLYPTCFLQHFAFSSIFQNSPMRMPSPLSSVGSTPNLSLAASRHSSVSALNVTDDPNMMILIAFTVRIDSLFNPANPTFETKPPLQSPGFQKVTSSYKEAEIEKLEKREHTLMLLSTEKNLLVFKDLFESTQSKWMKKNE
ncbi:putative Titin like protein [Blattamonas nauphoetae]|uniref:Titin like protein n=1 Tax=Blattamonas nauphoetae TaxID=2049346 RepID=A0ABQ9YEF5_9EUKA|nr:putative Titin like protein [Blattamonas nauphoetae]